MGISVRINLKSVFSSGATALSLLALLGCAGGSMNSATPLDQAGLQNPAGGVGGGQYAQPTYETGSPGPGMGMSEDDLMFLQVGLHGKETSRTDSTVKLLIFGHVVYRSHSTNPYREEHFKDGTAFRAVDPETKTYLDTNLFTRDGQQGAFEFSLEIPKSRFEEYSAKGFKGLLRYFVWKGITYDPQQLGIWRTCQTRPSKFAPQSKTETPSVENPDYYSQLINDTNTIRDQETNWVAPANSSLHTTRLGDTSHISSLVKSIDDSKNNDFRGDLITADSIDGSVARYSGEWQPDFSWMDFDQHDCPGL